MTPPDDIPVDRQSKRQRLGSIKANPSQWQVCEGCDRLVSITRVKCPHCHAYRFDPSAKRVKTAATAAAKLPAEDLPPM
jgi:hypothetical protein